MLHHLLHGSDGAGTVYGGNGGGDGMGKAGGDGGGDGSGEAGGADGGRPGCGSMSRLHEAGKEAMPAPPNSIRLGDLSGSFQSGMLTTSGVAPQRMASLICCALISGFAARSCAATPAT